MRSPDIVDRRLASGARRRNHSHCSVSCAFIAVPRLDIYCLAFEFGLSGGIHVAIVLDQLKRGQYEHLWQLIARWVGLYPPSPDGQEAISCDGPLSREAAVAV